MKNTSEITVSFSPRRPSPCGWQATSGIHSAYGKTEEEAISRLKDTVAVYAGLEAILKECVKKSEK